MQGPYLSPFSPDGSWWWSGERWLPAVSSDGRWRWTGTQWDQQSKTLWHTPTHAGGHFVLTWVAVISVAVGTAIFTTWAPTYSPRTDAYGYSTFDPSASVWPLLALALAFCGVASGAVRFFRTRTVPSFFVTLGAALACLIFGYAFIVVLTGFPGVA